MDLNEHIVIFDHALSTLIRTFTINERRFPSAEGRMAYSAHDFETLAYLDHWPGARAKDLGEHLGVKPTTTQSIIDRLVGRGLVRRDAAYLKGRAVALFLTEQGGSIQAAIQRQNLANCETMLSVLTKSERSAFVSSIAKIAATVEASKQPS